MTKEKFIYEHFCLIHKHLWPFSARSAKSFMNIYGFIDDHLWPKKARSAKNRRPFMIFFGPKNREAQNRRTFMLHRWLFLTKTKYKRVGVFVFSYSKTRPNKNDIDNQNPSNKRSIHLLNNSAKKRRIVKLSSLKIVAYKRKIVLL